jgi:hypothetical protein
VNREEQWPGLLFAVAPAAAGLPLRLPQAKVEASAGMLTRDAFLSSKKARH